MVEKSEAQEHDSEGYESIEGFGVGVEEHQAKQILEPSQDSISNQNAMLRDHGRRTCEGFSPAQA